jgi:hypothetical protein
MPDRVNMVEKGFIFILERNAYITSFGEVYPLQYENEAFFYHVYPVRHKNEAFFLPKTGDTCICIGEKGFIFMPDRVNMVEKGFIFIPA